MFQFEGENGKLLAWLAKGDIPATPIGCVRDKDDHILTAPDQMNACFLQFFQDLYFSRADFSPSDLYAFLNPISFPMLVAEDRKRLDVDITLEEVQLAMGWLKSGKAPGTDGLLSEFYSNFMEILAPKLTALISDYVWFPGGVARHYE